METCEKLPGAGLVGVTCVFYDNVLNCIFILEAYFYMFVMLHNRKNRRADSPFILALAAASSLRQVTF